MSSDSPIHEAAVEKPPQDHDVRVWLADGSEDAAIWTGEVWWTYRGAVDAVRWQKLPGTEGPSTDEAETK